MESVIIIVILAWPRILYCTCSVIVENPQGGTMSHTLSDSSHNGNPLVKKDVGPVRIICYMYLADLSCVFEGYI